MKKIVVLLVVTIIFITGCSMEKTNDAAPAIMSRPAGTM